MGQCDAQIFFRIKKNYSAVTPFAKGKKKKKKE